MIKTKVIDINTKRISLFLLLIISFSFSSQLNGQDAAINPKISINERTVHAPNTASLSKYFEVPVNMSNGTPNIQIPIYTIKVGSIELPITLTIILEG